MSRRKSPLTPRETGDREARRGELHEPRRSREALVISEKTVDRHRANILQKLGLHDRVELTRYAIRNGLVEA